MLVVAAQPRAATEAQPESGVIYLLIVASFVVCALLVYACWSGRQFLRIVKKDLNKQRDRDYPERCRECHLYPDSCTCTKRYSVRKGFNTPDRIRLGEWN